MSRVDQHLRYAVPGMLGSFWSRVATDVTKDQVRAVATLAANAPGVAWLSTPAAKLASSRSATVENVTVSYIDGDFVYVGPALADFWRSSLGLPDGQSFQIVRLNTEDRVNESTLLWGANGRPLGVNLGLLLEVVAVEDGLTGSDPLYVLPIPPDLTPIVIATRSERTLVQGIDFETGPGYIAMRESPSDTFHPGGFVVLVGRRELPLPYNYTMQINGPAYGHSYVADYYRGAQSVVSFERAAAQAAGLLVIEQSDLLLQAQQLTADEVRYVFANAGIVDVGYPHDALVVGRDYPKGFIVGAGFRIHRGDAAGWLKRAVGERVVSLRGVTPVADLFLPPGPLRVTFEGDTARLHVTGASAGVIAFWNLQRNHELLHGVHFVEAAALSPDNPAVMIDLHTVLEAYYGRSLLLVDPGGLDADPLLTARLLEFVEREKPLGSVVLVVASPPDGLEPGGGSEGAGDLAALYPIPPAVTADTVLIGIDYAGALLEYDGAPLVY